MSIPNHANSSRIHPGVDFSSVPTRRSPSDGPSGRLHAAPAVSTHGPGMVGLRLEDGVPVLSIPDAGTFEDVREAIRERLPELMDRIGGRACRLDMGQRDLQLFDLRRILHVLREEFKVDVTGLYVQPAAIHRYAERELKLKLFVPRIPVVEEKVEVKPEPTEEAVTASEDEVVADLPLPGAGDLLAVLSQPPGADLLIDEAEPEEAAEEPALAMRRAIPLPELPPDPRDEPEVDHQGGRRALTINRTLRSGAMIQYDGDVLVMGDVNAGAQIRAGGNVTVMGRLRGVVHAGAHGNDDAWILAFDLSPTQLRIGRQIAIAPERASRNDDSFQPELAQLLQGSIVIEPWKGRLRR